MTSPIWSLYVCEMPNQYLPVVNTIPNSLLILAITKSYPMVVTVVLYNYAPTPRVNVYIPGMNVKFYIPRTYGMLQLNNRIGNILSVSGNDLTIDIDSSGFDTYVIATPPEEYPASLSPAGSRNLEYSNTTRQVSFQSLNNIGN